jgi:outer membrane lipoprotein-sorting protein
MRSRFVLYIVIALVAVVAVIGTAVAVAGAGQTNPLPAVSAADLLAKMHEQSGQTTTISGDVSWKNNLLGDLSSITGSGMGASAQLPLVGSGSGRIWAGPDGLRVESQASGGDQVVVVNKASRDAWSYDYATSTATHYVTTGAASGTSQTPEPAAGVATPVAISLFLERLAPLAKVEVTGQATVAGREAYLVTMTPTAQDTALGSVQAAIDGTTYQPLRLQVFAAGDTSPVLEFGFTTVSYDAIPASQFTFTPPAGTTVTTKTIDLSKMSDAASADKTQHTAPSAAQQSALQKALRSLFLTVPEAQALVKYHVYAPQEYTARPFERAMVLDKGGPMTAVGQPLSDLLKGAGITLPDMGGSTAGAGSSTESQTLSGPVAVQVYGKGFGTIVLVETQSTAALDKQLKQLPALVDTTSVNGATVRSLTTPLGGAFIWQKGDTTLVAGGMVPAADLKAFVSSVQ